MDALRRARSYSSNACRTQAREPARRAAPRAGNRQTHRQGGRLQDLAPPLGDRAHILLAAPQSPPDGPLRSPRHDRRWLCQAHDDRGHAEAADGGGPLIYRANFRFRLLNRAKARGRGLALTLMLLCALTPRAWAASIEERMAPCLAC